ncbi:MAG: DMT family transporter [Cyanobacteria bacterium P01_E01_bin.42]
MTDRLEQAKNLLFSNKSIAILTLLIACFVFSFAPIFIKWSEREIDAISTVFVRFFIGTLVFSLGSCIDLQDNQKSDTKLMDFKFYSLRIFLFLLGAGVCTIANQTFWALSIVQTNIGNSAFMHSLSPLFTTSFAWLFLGRGINRQFFVGMVIAIGGSISIAMGDLQIATAKLQGDGLALISAIFFAIYLLIVERLRIYLSANSIMFWRCLLGSLLLFPILLLSGSKILPDSQSGWLAVFCLCASFSIGQGLLAHTLKILSSNLVAVILLLEPLLSTIQAWIFFAETLSISEWLSFIIVIVGVYLAISSHDRQVTE